MVCVALFSLVCGHAQREGCGGLAQTRSWPHACLPLCRWEEELSRRQQMEAMVEALQEVRGRWTCATVRFHGVESVFTRVCVHCAKPCVRGVKLVCPNVSSERPGVRGGPGGAEWEGGQTEGRAGGLQESYEWREWPLPFQSLTPTPLRLDAATFYTEFHSTLSSLDTKTILSLNPITNVYYTWI